MESTRPSVRKASATNPFPYPRPMPSRTQDQNPEFVHRAFSAIAKRYVLTNHVLSLGIDVLWRRKVARHVREHGGGLILDVATGSGDLARTVLDGGPGARVIGADFCAPMLAEAKKTRVARIDRLRRTRPSFSRRHLRCAHDRLRIAQYGRLVGSLARVRTRPQTRGHCRRTRFLSSRVGCPADALPVLSPPPSSPRRRILDWQPRSLRLSRGLDRAFSLGTGHARLARRSRFHRSDLGAPMRGHQQPLRGDPEHRKSARPK